MSGERARIKVAKALRSDMEALKERKSIYIALF